MPAGPLKADKRYDLLVVGSGLFGSILAFEARRRNRRVLVVEKRDHIGGNCFTEAWQGIHIHRYGAHIFRTDSRRIWDYMQQFCEFNNFINAPLANFKGELYNLPFNMNTFYSLWKTRTPHEAKQMIEAQRTPCDAPNNLEEHVLNLVGRDIYDKLVKGYTEKQWGRSCRELPASIMRRIPLRFTFDNNYFNALYQGIPLGGYTRIFERMLEGIEVRLGVDYLQHRPQLDELAPLVIYTGAIDAFYDYRFGPLEYRGLRFEQEILDTDNHQGVAVVNFTDFETPHTRVIEHRHFEPCAARQTVISREYPLEWQLGQEPFYPMEDAENIGRFERYAACAQREEQVRFGGRLGEYRYYDMQDTIASALQKATAWLD
jgi:UDP-galactopyranose mutase